MPFKLSMSLTTFQTSSAPVDNVVENLIRFMYRNTRALYFVIM